MINELVDRSVRLLQLAAPPNGYWGCFSGGKDSIVLKALAARAGVKVKWHYNQTTIDPPEVIYHMREYHRDVVWLPPRHGNFFVRMEAKGHIPTRRVRWCCDEYKERTTPKNKLLLMGIRAEESPARAKWEMVDIHWRTGRTVVLPILDWDSETVWEFIHGQRLPYPGLYDEGFHRLGCIGCPLANANVRKREFERWPRFERRWQLAFQRVWQKRKGTIQNNGQEWFGSALFGSWQELWDWWLHDRTLPKK